MPATVPEMVPAALLLSDVIVPLLLIPSVLLTILLSFTTTSELAPFIKAGAPVPSSRPLLVNVPAEPSAVMGTSPVDVSVPALVRVRFPPDQVTHPVVPVTVAVLLSEIQAA